MRRRAADVRSRAEIWPSLAPMPIFGAMADDVSLHGRPEARPCPICGKPSERGYRPFCSKRCADIDLHRWLAGSYAVPAVEGEELGDEEAGEARG